MKILAIDSSGLVASAAILEDEVLLAEYTTNFKKTHSQTLLPMIDELVRMTEQDLDTIDAIAVAKGPGSFTGLRIGAATAKGLALALKKPLIPVPTVDALAYNLFGTSGRICPLMDARRNQVYTGVYDFEGGKFRVLEPQMAVSIEEILAKQKEYQGETIFLGDGVPVFRENILKVLGTRAKFAPPHLSRQRAGALAGLAAEYFREGKIVASKDLRLDYLRLSQAERERLEKEETKVIIREMTPEDVDVVAEIEAENMSLPWSKDSLLDSLKQEFTHFFVACVEENKEIIGYCGSYFTKDEADLSLISVRKEYQRQGIAEKLLRKLYQEMKSAGISEMYLEVRTSNTAARKLYEKHGFSYIGKRVGYYDLPKEDALLMKLARIPIE